MNLAVGYVRCSTDMQEDSVHQQKREIQKWADAHDYKLIEWYEDEGRSGIYFEHRPAMPFLYTMNLAGGDPTIRARTHIGNFTLNALESKFES
jgi:hypothetical protein